jgi:hypothetical protein
LTAAVSARCTFKTPASDRSPAGTINLLRVCIRAQSRLVDDHEKPMGSSRERGSGRSPLRTTRRCCGSPRGSPGAWPTCCGSEAWVRRGIRRRWIRCFGTSRCSHRWPGRPCEAGSRRAAGRGRRSCAGAATVRDDRGRQPARQRLRPGPGSQASRTAVSLTSPARRSQGNDCRSSMTADFSTASSAPGGTGRPTWCSSRWS